MQESSLAQKAAESAATPQEYKLSPEAQNIVDEVQAGRERDTIRRRLAIYNDAMMQNTVNRFASGGGIHIDPSKRGTFTAAASRHGMGVQAFASKVLAHKENYSPAMVKKANFARNASHWHADGGPINILAKGGPRRFDNAAQMIEHFEGFRASPYRDGRAYSVGYGQYMYGDGANLDWENLLNGSKKLTKAEAHQQVLRSIDKLKGTLRRTLGDDLYNNLTPGQLMGYLDTGYQRPASMINAAKVHRQRGAQAAASVLGVNGFADRNAARRAAFTGNWGNESGYYNPTSDTSYTQATTGGYFSMPQNSPQVLATFGNEPTQDTFTPWWQQDGQQDENFLAQQAAGAAGGAYNISQFQPSWIEPVQNSGTFPQLFAHGGCIFPYVRPFDEGGPYNNGFMDYYGYSWVPGDRIMLSDPYFNEIQAHNPNGTYAVDNNGYYVPASTMKRQWDLYNSAPSMNTPATAVPLSEVTYIKQDKDQAAIDAAKRMFGDNRDVVYDDLWNRGSSSATDILNKLDTLAQNSAYMRLNTDPDYIERLKRNKYKRKLDGTLRAQYDTKNNVATIEPVVGNFFEPYISEFVHDYQYNNNVPELDLIGYNPRAVTRDRAAVDAAYRDPKSNEYKAHYILQPVMNRYLNTPSMSYADFVAALRAAQVPSYAKQ